MLQNRATSLSAVAAAWGGTGFGGAVTLPGLAGRGAAVGAGTGFSEAGTAPVVTGPESSAAHAVARIDALSLGIDEIGFCGPGARARAKDSRLSGFDCLASSSARTGEALASAEAATRRRSLAL